jgi:hypothetical protein
LVTECVTKGVTKRRKKLKGNVRRARWRIRKITRRKGEIQKRWKNN